MSGRRPHIHLHIHLSRHMWVRLMFMILFGTHTKNHHVDGDGTTPYRRRSTDDRRCGMEREQYTKPRQAASIVTLCPYNWTSTPYDIIPYVYMVCYTTIYIHIIPSVYVHMCTHNMLFIESVSMRPHAPNKRLLFHLNFFSHCFCYAVDIEY